jgi:hypothetical protein
MTVAVNCLQAAKFPDVAPLTLMGNEGIDALTMERTGSGADHQLIKSFTGYLFGSPAEHQFGLIIPVNDALIFIDGNKSINGGFNQRPKKHIPQRKLLTHGEVISIQLICRTLLRCHDTLSLRHK